MEPANQKTAVPIQIAHEATRCILTISLALCAPMHVPLNSGATPELLFTSVGKDFHTNRCKQSLNLGKDALVTRLLNPDYVCRNMCRKELVSWRSRSSLSAKDPAGQR